MANISHKPDEKTRAEVLALTGFGTSQADISTYLGIKEKTLRKYYKEELETGTLRANSTIARALYKKAVGGDTTSMIFWLKTRAKWRETDRLELTGADGGAVEISHLDKRLEDVLKGDPEARKTLAELYAKAFRNKD